MRSITLKEYNKLKQSKQPKLTKQQLQIEQIPLQPISQPIKLSMWAKIKHFWRK